MAPQPCNHPKGNKSSYSRLETTVATQIFQNSLISFQNPRVANEIRSTEYTKGVASVETKVGAVLHYC